LRTPFSDACFDTVQTHSRSWLGIGAAAIALLAVASVNGRDWLLYNHTPSVPPGWYMRSADVIALGAFVTVRAQDVAPDYAAARSFADRGDRFIKRIAASYGDSVCAEGETIRINDRTVAHRAVQDNQGRALPHWSGCRTLSADEVFLMGDTPDSFDSRYFGPVSAADIEGVWRPVF
jgi:conjugative transfer signal peptidase TraF